MVHLWTPGHFCGPAVERVSLAVRIGRRWDERQLITHVAVPVRAVQDLLRRHAHNRHLVQPAAVDRSPETSFCTPERKEVRSRLSTRLLLAAQARDCRLTAPGNLIHPRRHPAPPLRLSARRHQHRLQLQQQQQLHFMPRRHRTLGDERMGRHRQHRSQVLWRACLVAAFTHRQWPLRVI